MLRPLLTLITDFGTREYYVGALKGSILEVHPDIELVDLSHEVSSHDVLAGALTAAGSCPWFPPRTVHLIVVDPGVGSERRVLIAATDRHRYVAPDNGVLSLVFRQDPPSRVIAVEAEHYYRHPVCPTFHARDILGPVAAWLAKGIAVENFGSEVSDYKLLTLPSPVEESGRLHGRVLHIDKFGNIITTFTQRELDEFRTRHPQWRLRIGNKTIERLVQYYSQGAEGEAIALTGSSGFLEIAVARRPASQVLQVSRGMSVVLEPAGGLA